MHSINGSCLCGQVQYSSQAAPLTTAICHCADCQMQSGSAFSINLLVPAEGFQVQGTSLGKFCTTGASNQPVQRFFCNNCGSPLYSKLASMPGVLVIKAGTLTSSHDIKPELQMWCASAQPWMTLEPSLPQFSQTPTH